MDPAVRLAVAVFVLLVLVACVIGSLLGAVVG
jgi:hypothetical protein